MSIIMHIHRRKLRLNAFFIHFFFHFSFAFLMKVKSHEIIEKFTCYFFNFFKEYETGWLKNLLSNKICQLVGPHRYTIL